VESKLREKLHYIFGGFLMEERVFAQFKSAIDIGGSVDRAQLVYGEYPGWDSVAHMTLVAALETEFDCMLEMDDILDMSSFAKAVEIMGKYV
jgi:acyl carrier protein